MGQAIGSVLPLAVAIAIFPIPIIAVVLLLGSEHGVKKGIAFVAAWLVGLAGIGAVTLLFAGVLDASEAGGPATWVSVLLLAVGVLLVVLAFRQWRARPRGGAEAPMPRWMQRMDGFTAAKAAELGLALTVLNPKNLMLVGVAALEIADLGLPTGREIVVLGVFVLIASAGVLLPLVAAVVLGARSHAPLEAIREWMVRANATIMTVLFLLIGAKLIGDAIAGLSS
jgi:threonine/homoserine/homoserine lactone efflux protein